MKNNKQILLSLVGIIVVVIGSYMIFFFYRSPMLFEYQEKIYTKKIEGIKEKTSVVQKDVITYDSKKVEKHIGDKNVYFAQKNLIIKDAFKEVSVDEMRDILSPKEGVEPLSALHVKNGVIKSLKTGDRIILPQINNIEYELKIIKRTKNSDGSVTSNAQINEEDIRYFSILTEGKNTIFITLNSPEGSYQIEIFNGNGYVYSVGAIRNARIDYIKTDGIVPPKK